MKKSLLRVKKHPFIIGTHYYKSTWVDYTGMITSKHHKYCHYSYRQIVNSNVVVNDVK